MMDFHLAGNRVPGKQRQNVIVRILHLFPTDFPHPRLVTRLSRAQGHMDRRLILKHLMTADTSWMQKRGRK